MRPRRGDAGGAGLGSGLAETGAALLVILYIPYRMLIARIDHLVSDIHVPPVSVRVGPVVLSCLLGAQDGDGEMSIAEFVRRACICRP